MLGKYHEMLQNPRTSCARKFSNLKLVGDKVGWMAGGGRESELDKHYHAQP